MKGLFGQLAGKYRGPILVVGGGMRCWSDIEALGKSQHYQAIISANEHACKIPGLPVDFIVCKDDKHTENGEWMRDRLAPYNLPIISRHWWADYRLPEWKLQGNSGLMAIAVAAAMGGGPIYPVGFDFYQEGTHFHDPNARNMSRGKPTSAIKRDIMPVSEACLGTEVRPVSGMLTAVFKPYQPGPFISRYLEPAIVSKYRDMAGLRVRAVREFALRFAPGATIPVGTEFWMSEGEYRMPNGYENAEPI